MKKVNLLSRAEMRNVMGGRADDDGCITSECSTDDGCKSSQYGKTCKLSTCLSTGQPANYCYNKDAS